MVGKHATIDSQCGEEVHDATATGDNPRRLARLRLEMSMFIAVMCKWVEHYKPKGSHQ